MKKVVILLIAAVALLSFSCNKYCHCKRYIVIGEERELDKNYKNSFVKESQRSCEDFNGTTEEDGVTTEVKCK